MQRSSTVKRLKQIKRLPNIGTLKLTKFKGVNLPSVDGVQSNPLLIASLVYGMEDVVEFKSKTSVCKGTLNPTWIDDFTFAVKNPEQQKLIINLVYVNKKKEYPVKEFTVAMRDVFKSIETEWQHDLNLEFDSSTICLSLSFVPDYKEDAITPPTSPFTRSLNRSITSLLPQYDNSTPITSNAELPNEDKKKFITSNPTPSTQINRKGSSRTTRVGFQAHRREASDKINGVSRAELIRRITVSSDSPPEFPLKTASFPSEQLLPPFSSSNNNLPRYDLETTQEDITPDGNHAVMDFSLNLAVKEGKGLCSETNLKPDDITVCVVNIDDIWLQTAKSFIGPKPVWDTSFSLNIKDLSKSIINFYVLQVTPQEYIPISKLTIPIAILTTDKNKLSWYDLTLMHPPTYITGDIQISTSSGDSVFNVRVGKAKKLLYPEEKFSCFTEVQLFLNTKTEPIIKKTKINKYNNFEIDFNEILNFDTDEGKPVKLHIKVWKSKGTIKKPIGEVVIDKDIRALEHKFLLKPNETIVQKEKESALENSIANRSCGSIRLETDLKGQLLFGPEYYAPLAKLLEKNKVAFFRILRRTTLKSGRAAVATSLLRLCETMKLTKQLLKIMVEEEVRHANKTEVLFRADTLSTKIIDEYFQSMGVKYLHNLLRTSVQNIIDLGITCEIEPTKLGKDEDIQKNFKSLLELSQDLLSRIYKSSDDCPYQMRHIMNVLYKEIADKFPTEQNAKYISVSGFLFLRLIGPATMNPEKFNIPLKLPLGQTPIGKVALSNVAKVIQKIANMTKKKMNETPNNEHFVQLDKFVEEEQPKMKTYIDIISNPVDQEFPTTVGNDISAERELALIADHLESQVETLISLVETKLENDEKKDLFKGVDVDHQQIKVAQDLLKILSNMALTKTKNPLSMRLENEVIKVQERGKKLEEAKRALEIYEKLRSPPKFRVGKIAIKLTKYNRSFKGQSLLTWLLDNATFGCSNESEARDVASLLLGYGFMYPLAKVPSKIRLETKAIYRFYEDKDKQVLNMKYLFMSNCRNPLDVVNDMILLCKDLYINTKFLQNGNLTKSLQFNNLKEISHELQSASLKGLTGNEKLSMFINLYNTIYYHGCVTFGFPNNASKREMFLNKVGYIIGNHKYSLDDIHHGILRGNRKAPFSTRKQFKEDDTRLKYLFEELDPRIHFALMNVHKNLPEMFVFTPGNVEEQLEEKTKNFIASDIEINVDTKTMKVSSIFKLYSTDFGKNDDEKAAFISKYLPEGHPAKHMVEKNISLSFAYTDGFWDNSPNKISDPENTDDAKETMTLRDSSSTSEDMQDGGEVSVM